VPTPPLSQEKRSEVWRLLGQGLSNAKIASLVGISTGSVSKIRRSEPEEAPVTPGAERTDEVKGDSWTITLPRTDFHTLDALLKYCEVDTRIWEVERFVCNKWEMGYKGKDDQPHTQPLYQIKAWLKKKSAAVLDIQAALEQFKTEAAKYAPKFPPQIIRMRSKYSTGVWVEHSPVDHHFGAMIWGQETGGPDYDLPLAQKCWREAIIANCERTDSFKPEGAVFPVGNDQQQTDNRANGTEKGTPQSVDSRYQKVNRVSRKETVWAVDQYLARYGRVHIIPVPGNHDFLAAFHLGEYLEAWYRNDPRVTVDTRPLFRKYWEHGVVGIGFLHGNTGKLENYGQTFAAEEPELWGRTKWHEMHSADKHQRRLIEVPGCAVRILPSLRPQCAWSSEYMLIGSIRAAESYVWSKTEGLIGSATFSVLPPKKTA
jgi:hypothetical protein